MSQLTLTVENNIAIIQFDNPPLQVMTPSTMNDLNAMLPRLAEPDIRAVVFSGNPASGYFIRHFSVEELDDNTKGASGSWDRSMDDVLWDLEHLSKPVIAAIEGSAWGGGLEFALACDIRVVKDGKYSFGLPEVSVGILPGGGGTQRLTEIVGRGKAMSMMLRPKMFSAQEGVALGIFEEFVPADASESALERAVAIAGEIAARSPHSVSRIKALVRGAVAPVSKQMLALESEKFAELLQTDEAKQGLGAAAGRHREERGSV